MPRTRNSHTPAGSRSSQTRVWSVRGASEGKIKRVPPASSCSSARGAKPRRSPALNRRRDDLILSSMDTARHEKPQLPPPPPLHHPNLFTVVKPWWNPVRCLATGTPYHRHLGVGLHVAHYHHDETEFLAEPEHRASKPARGSVARSYFMGTTRHKKGQLPLPWTTTASLTCC